MRATEFINKQQGVAEDTLNEFATDSGGGGDDILKTLAAQWLNGDVSSGDLDSDIQSQEKVERRLEKGVTCPDGVKRKLYIDYSDDYEGVVIYGDDNWSITYKQDDLSESHQSVAEGHLNEDVGGNYLYYSVESSNDAKLILSSGYIKASGGAQTATQQQTKLPVVSVSRSINYAVSGANVERDYQVVFVLNRNAIESRYKTFGTSQHEPTKSDNIFYNDTSLNYQLFQQYSKIDTNRDGKMSDQELDAYYAIDKRPSAVMAQLLNQKYATLLTKYNRSKSGKEFEEVIPVKSGQLPLKGILVGFYLVPNKAAAKDQELLNNPMRLAMPRPNTFVKVIQQGVAEGSDAEAYKEKLLTTLPQMMRFFEKNGKGWKPSKEQMLAAVETGYTVMKHTGDVKQAGKAMMDELNRIQPVAEGTENNLSTIIQSFVASPVGQKYKKHDCKTVTRAFVAWAEQNKIPTTVVSLAPPSADFIAKNPRYKGKSGQGDGHIMPIVNGNAIDFTVRQFGVSRPFNNPLVTPTSSLPAVYGKFGYFTDKPEWFLGGKSHWIGALNSIPSEIFNQNFGDELLEQGMAEGSIPVYKSPSQFYAGGKKIYQLFRSAFPNLPEHVANDIYNQTKPGTNETIVNALNQGQDPKRVFLDYYTGVTFNFQQDPGTNLTPEQLKKVLLNGKWKQQILLVNPADFSEHSRNRMIKRNFGINPDEDPIRIQRQQAKAKGDGSNEPVIIIQTSSGFVLWEGFHRTMSILSVGKNGNDPLKWNKVKLRAWVVTFETQGVAEGSEVNSNLNVLHNKKTYQQTLQVLQTAYGDEEGQQMLDQYIQAVDQLIHSGGTIYRGVWVSPGKKPRLKNAGQHWTLTAQAAEEYLDSNAGWSAYADFQSDNKGIQPVPYIISAQVGPNSITNNGVSFDQFPEELEVRLVNPQTAKMKIVKKVEGLALESRYPVGQLQSQAQERGSQGVAEAWSEKYKRSINCDNPKGFSQRAHCQGRKKNNEQIELDERKKKRKTTKKTNRYFYGPVYYGGYYGTGDSSGDSGGGE